MRLHYFGNGVAEKWIAGIIESFVGLVLSATYSHFSLKEKKNADGAKLLGDAAKSKASSIKADEVPEAKS